jgi:hypothetical protein
VSRNVRYTVSRIKAILQRNTELLKDEDVRRWLRLLYPLLLEHSSVRDKEFFESIYSELFD